MLNDIRSGPSRVICRVSLQLRGGSSGGGAIDPADEICFRFDVDDELFNEPGRGRVVCADEPAAIAAIVLCAVEEWTIYS